jgi:ferritin
MLCRCNHAGADTAAVLDAESEVGVNEQIAHEYTMSYMYHAMSSYFNRDNVALPGVRCQGAAG